MVSMANEGPIMHLSKLFYFASALTLTLSACATTERESGNDLLLSQCFVAALLKGSQAGGVQFTNNCETCVAVAFDTQPPHSDVNGRNACFVPAKTRVVFSELRSYRISALQDCGRVQKEGSIDGVPAAILTRNYKSGRCAIVGEFND